MMAPTHRLGGIAAGIATATLIHTDTAGTLIILAGALVGSIFPDIDNKNSRISYKMPITALIVSAGKYIVRIIASSLPRKKKQYVMSLIGHRGLTHSLIGSTIFPAIVILLGLLFKIKAGYVLLAGLSIFIGCLSHLILDMVSGGVPLFMPFSTDLYIIAKIKTGSNKEWIFRVCFVIILFFCIMKR